MAIHRLIVRGLCPIVVIIVALSREQRYPAHRCPGRATIGVPNRHLAEYKFFHRTIAVLLFYAIRACTVLYCLR